MGRAGHKAVIAEGSAPVRGLAVPCLVVPALHLMCFRAVRQPWQLQGQQVAPLGIAICHFSSTWSDTGQALPGPLGRWPRDACPSARVRLGPQVTLDCPAGLATPESQSYSGR